MKSLPSEIEFIHNSGSAPHIKIVTEMMKGAKQVFICMAYLKMSGLVLIQRAVDKALKSGSQLTVIVGTDQYITEPEALKSLFSKVKNRKGCMAFLVPQGSGSTFHPKVYFVKKGSVAEALVGSANITGGGLKTNVEASIYAKMDTSSRFCKELQSFIEELRNARSSMPFSVVAISQYEARYQIHKKQRNQAERTAKRETRELVEINVSKLQKLLAEYSQNDEHIENHRAKTSNYRIAKKVLNQITGLRKPTKARFMELYEQLVGKSGGDKLWHSGSVYRKKNIVARRYQRVMALIKDMKRRIGQKPDVVYAAALEHSKDILGLGPNVITEILNTYAPRQYAVLNKNPLESLKHLGFSKYPGADLFKPETYKDYCSFMKELQKTCGLKNLADLDHFLNYVYWKYKNEKEARQ